jgi:hypothetical protein
MRDAVTIAFNRLIACLLDCDFRLFQCREKQKERKIETEEGGERPRRISCLLYDFVSAHRLFAFWHSVNPAI